MLALALVALIASAAVTYAIGAAIIASREAFLRSKVGMRILVGATLVIVFLPPQLTALGGTVDSTISDVEMSVENSVATSMLTSMGTTVSIGADSSTTGMFAWPAGLDKGFYVSLWALLSVLSLLVGMRVWEAGKPGWRSTGSSTWDTSAVGRARGFLPLADTLAEALDAIGRSGVDARGAGFLAEELQAVGRRFANDLPSSSGDTYRLVAEALPVPIASAITKYLLEGAAEGRQRSSP